MKVLGNGTSPVERQKRVRSRLSEVKARMPFSRMGKKQTRKTIRILGRKPKPNQVTKMGAKDDLGHHLQRDREGIEGPAHHEREGNQHGKRHAQQDGDAEADDRLHAGDQGVFPDAMDVADVLHQDRARRRDDIERDMEEADDRLPGQDEADAEDDRRQIFGDLVAVHHRRPQISP
jgi:hypothetical protein